MKMLKQLYNKMEYNFVEYMMDMEEIKHHNFLHITYIMKYFNIKKSFRTNNITK